MAKKSSKKSKTKSSSNKRRNSERARSKGARSSRAGKKQATSGADNPPKSSEFLALLFFLLAVFLLLSTISVIWHNYRFSDLSILSSQPSGNLMGPVGHFVGTVLVGFMGWCSLVPAVWAGSLCWHFWGGQSATPSGGANFSIGVVGIGIAAVLLVACALGAIIGGAEGGGVVGAFIADPLSSLFGRFGAGAISAALLLISLSLASQESLQDILQRAFHRVRTGGQVFIIEIPLNVLRMLLEVSVLGLRSFLFCSCIVWEYVGGLIGNRLDRMEEDEEPLPRPRKRRNKVPAEDSRRVGAEAATHVVVKRQPRPKDRPKKIPFKSSGTDSLLSELNERYASYEPPSVDLLSEPASAGGVEDDADLREKSQMIESKLLDFGIEGQVTHVHPGPVITLFEFKPAPGVKVNKIAGLQDDLAMSLRAASIRILAPIPKRGTVGIEVPNKSREVVKLRELLESDDFLNDDSTLTVPVGKDTYGNPIVADIARMPHLLIAGATGTGKSVCINAMLLSLLYRANPAELGLILIDPKILELSIYEDIPHLRVPVVTDSRKARAVLLWAVNEMERRYHLMQKYGVRSIDGFNTLVSGKEFDELKEKHAATEAEQASVNGDENPQEPLFAEVLTALPKIVIVIDELADLMLSVGREIEELITRLAQKARAAGLHLIIATQRPSVDVITGLIKANFPARISFRVASRVDSRTILDSMGAEKLLGRGDMLFMRPGTMQSVRAHGAYVSDSEVRRVAASIKKSCKPYYDPKIMAMCEKIMEEEEGGSSATSSQDEDYDAYYDKAVELVLDKGQASTSMIQRAFRIGYNRAARIIDTMERDGLVGPIDGSKPRQVLLNRSDEGL